jgi:hypothetical protein
MDYSKAGKLGYEKTKDQIAEYLEEMKRRAREKYESNPKNCLTCGEKISYEKRRNKFCSHSCAAKHNNLGVTRHIKHSKFCSCGKPKKLQNKYCQECADNMVYIKVYDLANANSDRIRRRVLLQQRGHQCEVCGFSEWMGKPIAIELDHIDGDADNNTEENLRLICPNCHAQTESYKGANAGKGSLRQAKRRRRYAEGKTY